MAPQSASLLRGLLTEFGDAAQSGQRPIVIFDLDSTLYDVSPRIAKILHSFAVLPEVKLHHPEASKLLLQVTPQPTDYGIRRTLERYGFTPPSEAFVQQLVDYWKKLFFGNDYLKHDRPYEGALDFVLEAQKLGAEVLYLTGRDAPRMKQGTISSLIEHGFPLKENLENLHLKPHTETDDAEFKRQFFAAWPRDQRPVWFFENEPINIHLALGALPSLKPIFVNTVHSQRHPEPEDHVPQITHFRWK
ncbi:MAG: HAD family hydrolase [Oligoflexia bacterium]|nr:HAD family hydrolase [Oligoflexia bacterium]